MNNTNSKDKIHAISGAGLTMLALGTSGGAWGDQDLIKQGEENFKVNLGGIINQNNTSLRLDSSSGQSREFNLEDAGLKEDSSGFLGWLTWRFAANHRIGVQTFAIHYRSIADLHPRSRKRHVERFGRCAVLLFAIATSIQPTTEP